MRSLQAWVHPGALLAFVSEARKTGGRVVNKQKNQIMQNLVGDGNSRWGMLAGVALSLCGTGLNAADPLPLEPVPTLKVPQKVTDAPSDNGPLGTELRVLDSEIAVIDVELERSTDRLARLRALKSLGHASWSETAAAECEVAKQQAHKESLTRLRKTWSNSAATKPPENLVADAAARKWLVLPWPGNDERTVWIDVARLSDKGQDLLKQLIHQHDLEVSRFDALSTARQAEAQNLRDLLGRLQLVPRRVEQRAEEELVALRLKVAEARARLVLAQRDRERVRSARFRREVHAQIRSGSR